MQGTLCPVSGFCGVAECGAWSVGATDPGTPCNSDADDELQAAIAAGTVPPGGASAGGAAGGRASGARRSSAAAPLFVAAALLALVR